MEFAASLAHGFVDLDVTMVSGLAAGIATAAMSAAVESGGRVVAVIGTGIGRMYPPGNAGLRERILRNSGLVLSQFSPAFPRRPVVVPSTEPHHERVREGQRDHGGRRAVR